MAGTGRNCLDSDPIWTRLVVLILLPTVLLSVSPISAHTDDELDAWMTTWGYRTLTEGVTSHSLGEYDNMGRRHPTYFGRLIPHTHPQNRNTYYAGGVERWRPLVATYFAPGDVDTALRIMSCESGGDPNAYHSGSGASGLMQHLKRYWVSRSAAAGFAGASIFDPTANVATAAWLRDQPGGWLHWRACL